MSQAESTETIIEHTSPGSSSEKASEPSTEAQTTTVINSPPVKPAVDLPRSVIQPPSSQKSVLAKTAQTKPSSHVQTPPSEKTASNKTTPPSPDKADKPSNVDPVVERARLARLRYQSYIQKRRLQKRRRIILSRLRILAKLLFFVGCCAATVALWFAPFWLFHPAAETVSLTSPDTFTLLSADTLAPLIHAQKGHSVALLNTHDIEAQLKDRYPIIQDVQFRRHLFPAGITAIWTEYKPWALLVNHPNQPVPDRIISDNYKPMSVKHYQLPMAAHAEIILPKIIRGANQPLSPAQWMTVDRLIQQLQSIRPLKLQGVDLRNLNDVTAYYQQTAVRLGRFDGQINERLKALVYLVPEVLKRQGQLAWVDLRWEKQVILKLRSGAQVQAQSEVAHDPH